MKILKSSFFIIGSIIGAGFASGREIFQYFGKYGVYSLFFIIPLFFLFYIFIRTYLKFGHNIKNNNLKDSNQFLCGHFTLFKYKINIFSIMSFLTFLILSSSMFTAIIALIQTYFSSISRTFCYFLVILITFILSKMSLNLFSSISNVVVPLIIFAIVLNTLCSFASDSFLFNFGISEYFTLPFLTVLYVSQNAFFSSYVILQTSKNLTNKEQKMVSLLTSLFLCILICLGILCFCFNPSLAYSEMPFAEVVIKINPIFSFMFAIVLLLSILTTFTTSISSFKQYFSGKKIYNNIYAMIALISALSLFNFGEIIKYFYPIIGCFGVIYFIKIYIFNNKFGINYNKAKNYDFSLK